MRARLDTVWVCTTLQGMAKDHPFSLRMEAEMRDRLRELAEADGRALANYIHKVLREHLAAEDAKKAKSSRK